MKMFGNVCYAMGIVVALGLVLSIGAKPMEDAVGAVQCDLQFGYHACADVTEETTHPSGWVIIVTIQPSCPGTFADEKVGGFGVTQDGTAGDGYGDMECTTPILCLESMESRPYNHHCSPE